MKKIFVFPLLLIIFLFLCLGYSLAQTRKAETISTITWWECASVELNISGATILIDPLFPFYRSADIILVTHVHWDHCHPATIKRIIEASGDRLRLIIGSKQCEDIFREFTIKKEVLAGRSETIKHLGLSIGTVPSYEDETDVGYIIRDLQTGLSVMHMGDSTRYTEDFPKISDIDYLCLSMGKMSYEDMISFIKAVKPRYLIPMHYVPTKGAFLGEHGYSYPSPENPSEYINELIERMEQNNIETEVLALYPGETVALSH